MYASDWKNDSTLQRIIEKSLRNFVFPWKFLESESNIAGDSAMYGVIIHLSNSEDSIQNFETLAMTSVLKVLFSACSFQTCPL